MTMRRCWFCGQRLLSYTVPPAGDRCHRCGEWTPRATRPRWGDGYLRWAGMARGPVTKYQWLGKWRVGYRLFPTRREARLWLVRRLVRWYRRNVG